MSTLTACSNIIALVGQAIEDGARQDRACKVISLSERTLQGCSVTNPGGTNGPFACSSPRTRSVRRTPGCSGSGLV